MATTTRDPTLSAAAPSLASGARLNGARTVDAARVAATDSKKSWWRCFVRCFCCFGGRRRRRRAVETMPSNLPSAPSPVLPAPQEASPLPVHPSPPFPESDEAFPFSAPSPLPSPITEVIPSLPTPEPPQTVTPDEGKKRKRKRRRRTPQASTRPHIPTPAPAPTQTLTPNAAPAHASTPARTHAPACNETPEDVLDLVLLRRGQELPHNRVVYVEGEDTMCTDCDRWTESSGRRARGRRPLLEEPPAAAPNAANTTEAAAGSRGRNARGRRQEPSAAATAAKRQPRGRQRAAPGPVWASWEEPEVECLLPVPPHLRRRIVGRGGAYLRDLRRQFPAVRVRVPPPQDTTSRSVAVEGPSAQVKGALSHLRARLSEAATPIPYGQPSNASARHYQPPR